MPYLASLAQTARRNADTLVEFKQYILDMRDRARHGLAYLAKTQGETFFTGYDKIPDVLQAALENR
jgi:hypothetical protein